MCTQHLGEGLEVYQQSLLDALCWKGCFVTPPPDALQGSTLYLSTCGQQSLPDTLSANPYLMVRVTELDKDSKLQIL